MLDCDMLFLYFKFKLAAVPVSRLAPGQLLRGCLMQATVTVTVAFPGRLGVPAQRQIASGCLEIGSTSDPGRDHCPEPVVWRRQSIPASSKYSSN